MEINNLKAKEQALIDLIEEYEKIEDNEFVGYFEEELKEVRRRIKQLTRPYVSQGKRKKINKK